MFPYQNPSLSPEERAKDLLSRMTVREKVGQINQRLHGFDSYERVKDEKTGGETVRLSDEFVREVERWGGLGLLYGLYRADPWSQKDFTNGLAGEAAPRIYNEVQRFVISRSRFGIPVLLSEESPHGHQALDGYLLPVNLAMGCAFDPALAESAFRVAGRQMKALHADLALASMLDMLRDPRWGRSEECYSEDPLLASRMAAAAIRGLRHSGMDAVAKHCAAQGETTGGVNASAARIGERELREIHLPPVESAAKAWARAVMAAYNEIDGVPCHGNSWLLGDVLRGEFGFNGFVMADGVAIDRLDLVSSPDYASRGAAALNAGVDVSLWDRGFTALEEALERGLISEERLDEAVLRVLTLKFERGLFEHPYMEEGAPDLPSMEKDPETVSLARESEVLLKNEGGVLPFSDSVRSVAVIGPFASDVYAQLGDYTPPQRPGACVSYLEGIRAAAARRNDPPEIRAYTGPVPADPEARAAYIREAAALAGECEAVVAVIGGSSSRFENLVFDDNGAVKSLPSADSSKYLRLTDCGEGVDTAEIELPGWQRDLLAAIRNAAGEKPVVGLLNAGRPYASDSFAPLCDAVLCAFYGGPAAGLAAGEILFGEVCPSGRLSVSFPRRTGEIPACYNRRASYDPRYSDLPGEPDYPLGFGLSYACFRPCGGENGIGGTGVTLQSGGEAIPLCTLRRGVRPEEIPEIPAEKLAKDGLTLSFRLKNVGEVMGTAVPMLFVKHHSGSAIPRVRQLGDFARVPFEAGEEREITLHLTPAVLATLTRDMKREIEPGLKELLLWEGDRFLLRLAVKVTK